MLAVLNRRSPDRIPWVPRLELWYNARLAEGNLPERYQGMSLRQVERAMGVGTPARVGRVVATRYENVEVRQTEKDGEVLTEYLTPVGTVSKLDVKTHALKDYAGDRLPKAHPIKRLEDYCVMEYIYEHTYFDSTFDEF